MGSYYRPFRQCILIMSCIAYIHIALLIPLANQRNVIECSGIPVNFFSDVMIEVVEQEFSSHVAILHEVLDIPIIRLVSFFMIFFLGARDFVIES